MKNHVASLEWAKKLKELNCKQESVWYWRVDVDYGNTFLDLSPKLSIDVMLAKQKVGKTYKYYSAFTVAELGEMLPQNIDIPNEKTHDLRDVKHYVLRCEKVKNGYDTKNGWNVCYVGKLYVLRCMQADTEANARAKMWIWLRNQELI